jgi:hypothetical protein
MNALSTNIDTRRSAYIHDGGILMMAVVVGRCVWMVVVVAVRRSWWRRRGRTNPSEMSRSFNQPSFRYCFPNVLYIESRRECGEGCGCCWWWWWWCRRRDVVEMAERWGRRGGRDVTVMGC